MIEIIFVSFYPINFRFSTIIDIIMVYDLFFLQEFFSSFRYFWRESEVTNIKPKFKFNISIHLMATAERASSHKSKTEEITKPS